MISLETKIRLFLDSKDLSFMGKSHVSYYGACPEGILLLGSFFNESHIPKFSSLLGREVGHGYEIQVDNLGAKSTHWYLGVDWAIQERPDTLGIGTMREYIVNASGRETSNGPDLKTVVFKITKLNNAENFILNGGI